MNQDNNPKKGGLHQILSEKNEKRTGRAAKLYDTALVVLEDRINKHQGYLDSYGCYVVKLKYGISKSFEIKYDEDTSNLSIFDKGLFCVLDAHISLYSNDIRLLEYTSGKWESALLSEAEKIKAASKEG